MNDWILDAFIKFAISLPLCDCTEYIYNFNLLFTCMIFLDIIVPRMPCMPPMDIISPGMPQNGAGHQVCHLLISFLSFHLTQRIKRFQELKKRNFTISSVYLSKISVFTRMTRVPPAGSPQDRDDLISWMLNRTRSQQKVLL